MEKYQRLVCIIAFIVYYETSAFAQYSTCPQGEARFNYPVERKDPYDFQTLIPVALESEDAYPVCLPKLKIQINRNAQLNVTNNGQAVSIVPSSPDEVVATATGGPVFNSTYIFFFLSYIADGFPFNTRCTDTLDGEGFPIKFYAIFYNQDYGSPENSVNFEDGQLRFNIPMIVQGNVANPAFTETQNALLRVSKANSSTTANAKKVLSWLFDVFYPNRPGEYYSYPGARTAPGKPSSYCVIEIMPSFERKLSISLEQFNDTFPKILNNFGEPEFSSFALNPLGQRPFVQAKNSSVCVRCRSSL